jgi:hypothetical protein
MAARYRDIGGTPGPCQCMSESGRQARSAAALSTGEPALGLGAPSAEDHPAGRAHPRRSGSHWLWPRHLPSKLEARCQWGAATVRRVDVASGSSARHSESAWAPARRGGAPRRCSQAGSGSPSLRVGLPARGGVFQMPAAWRIVPADVPRRSMRQPGAIDPGLHGRSHAGRGGCQCGAVFVRLMEGCLIMMCF